jgi:hypothetical protein
MILSSFGLTPLPRPKDILPLTFVSLWADDGVRHYTSKSGCPVAYSCFL